MPRQHNGLAHPPGPSCMKGCAAPKDLTSDAGRRRVLRRFASALVVLSSALLNIQCLKDFAGPPDPPEYLVEALSQEIDTVHVGDKVSPPEAKLLVDGTRTTTAWEAIVIEGTDVMSVDSADNQIHLIV